MSTAIEEPVEEEPEKIPVDEETKLIQAKLFFKFRQPTSLELEQYRDSSMVLSLSVLIPTLLCLLF